MYIVVVSDLQKKIPFSKQFPCHGSLNYCCRPTWCKTEIHVTAVCIEKSIFTLSEGSGMFYSSGLRISIYFQRDPEYIQSSDRKVITCNTGNSVRLHSLWELGKQQLNGIGISAYLWESGVGKEKLCEREQPCCILTGKWERAITFTGNWEKTQ